jgi:hypothetical protein
MPLQKAVINSHIDPRASGLNGQIVICILRMRNRTLTNREKNCRQGRFAVETRQSRGRQRIS